MAVFRRKNVCIFNCFWLDVDDGGSILLVAADKATLRWTISSDSFYVSIALHVPKGRVEQGGAAFLFRLSSGGWIKNIASAPTLPRIKYMSWVNFTPSLPLQQQLTLQLPGA